LIVAVFLSTGCAADKVDKDQLNAGYADLDSAHYDEAIAVADQQLAKNSNGKSEGTAEALYLKGRAFEQRVKSSRGEAGADMNTAADCYQRALGMSPVPSLEANIRTSLGNVQYWRDDYSSALQEWTRAYELLNTPDMKSFVLYRAGLCQQRLGQFDIADKTFAAVQERFANSDAANRAREHQGFHSFSVRLATFSNPQSADAALLSLRKGGAAANKQSDAKQRSIVTVGPVGTYAQAQALKARFIAQYPDAMIVP
jgi:tetratricopeptide (TPR) repeat protein